MSQKSLGAMTQAVRHTWSNVVASVVGAFIAANVASMSGLFRWFWLNGGNTWPEEDRLGFFLFGLKTLISDSIQRGWLLGLLITPLLFIPFIKRSTVVQIAVWTVCGAIYGYFAFGYVKRGDMSGLVLAPYGLYCGLIAPLIHIWLWKGLRWAKNGLVRLHEAEVG